MPPHCDSIDGPVVTAARRALQVGDSDLVLPYVQPEGEKEVRHAFDLAVAVRPLGPEAREVAEQWFFETVVRVHRLGEGAGFTGLKPAGIGVGPVIPAAERALETGTPEPLIQVLCQILQEEIKRRHGHAAELKRDADESVAAARRYVEASLGLQVWAHSVYRRAVSDPHSGGDRGE